MGDRGVEFVVDDDLFADGNGDGDVMAENSHGGRTVFVVIAVLAVAVALVVRGFAGHDHKQRAAPASASVSVSVSRLPNQGPIPAPTVRPAGCPEGLTCDIVRTVPAATVAAVRGTFPTARLQSALSVVTREGARFGSPLVLRRVAFDFGSTQVSIAMTQRRCVDTEPGDRVTRQMDGRLTATLLVKAVPGDVEGDTGPNSAGDAAEAYCFLDSILVEQPRGDPPIQIVELDQLAVNESLRSTG